MSIDRPGAQHISSRLMRESLVDKGVIAATESPVRAILPNLNVVQSAGCRSWTAAIPRCCR